MIIEKLKDDPIVETLLEIQFTSPELQEVTVGRLSDLSVWKNAVKQRLPAADVPASIRALNPAFMYQPTVEVQGADSGITVVRIGGNVLSVHFVRPYQGWKIVYPTLKRIVDEMFSIVESLRVTRLGLRYINAFTPQRHHVSSLRSLALSIEVADQQLEEPIRLGYLAKGNLHEVMTTVVSKEFARGKLPEETSVILDIDVHTPSDFAATSSREVNIWMDEAHHVEKNAFSRLLPRDLYLKLKETSDAITH